MSTGFIASISLGWSLLRECDFWVNPEAPTGRLNCSVHLDLGDDALARDDGHYALPVSLKVELVLSDEATGGAKPIERMHARMTIDGSVNVSDAVDASEDEVFKSLRLNGVSLLYSQARAHIEYLTAMSAVSRFSLPTIDPARFIESIDGHDE